ncbi:hypothetical protein SVIOM74S_08892 [Streptomyces violarus]
MPRSSACGVAPARAEFLVEAGGVDAGADEHQLGEAFAAGRPGLRVVAQEPPDSMDGVAVQDVVRPEVDIALDPYSPSGRLSRNSISRRGSRGSRETNDRLS